MRGARPGKQTWLRRFVAEAMADDLAAFVVPDARLLREAGMDLKAAGLCLAATVRHASVLVLIDPVPDGLAAAAAVAYAQMPRPRYILAVGTASAAGLPVPDVVVAPEQESLAAGVRDLRRRIAAGAFSPTATPFEPVATLMRHAYVCPMHPEIVRDEPGTCPICGMDLAGGIAEQDEPHSGEATDEQPADKSGQEETDDGNEAAGEMDHGAGMHDEDMGSDDMGHDNMDHEDMGHEGMGHDHDMSGGFMSMVAMTKDLPRSRDGLPMDRVEAAFGPLFPGLPGGLALTLTLDGDGVAAAEIDGDATCRGLADTWGGPVATFPNRLSRLDPLAPVAYRLLAHRAIEAAAGIEPSEAICRARLWQAEWERVRSHLGWLAEFAGLLGDRALATRAAALHLGFARAAGGAAAGLAAQANALVATVADDPAIRVRLRGVGRLSGNDLVRSGPVARAAGQAVDARLSDPCYLAAGFVPAVADGDDALARLRVRLTEVTASLRLLSELPPSRDAAVGPVPEDCSGTAEAAVEAPGGTGRLRVEVTNGRVVAVHLETPTGVNAALVPAATADAEVADALVAVASLGLSPWELGR